MVSESEAVTYFLVIDYVRAGEGSVLITAIADPILQVRVALHMAINIMYYAMLIVPTYALVHGAPLFTSCFKVLETTANVCQIAYTNTNDHACAGVGKELHSESVDLTIVIKVLNIDPCADGKISKPIVTKDHVGLVLTIPIAMDGNWFDVLVTTNIVATISLTMASGRIILLFIPLLFITDTEVGVELKITDSIVSIYMFLGSYDDEK